MSRGDFSNRDEFEIELEGEREQLRRAHSNKKRRAEDRNDEPKRPRAETSKRRRRRDWMDILDDEDVFEEETEYDVSRTNRRRENSF